ncbi:cob(I)yrinic acid a,c-diamide adenosyltransferase [Emcibacter sp. SYSU 3D8]|uniref:cob(I)yrinic acid a,c-diamide adenosyltransferase n=1 Tax=Emcibacter sp. SYSU 3D8 TaxID=3133969 RepID=UPI0031FF39DD
MVKLNKIYTRGGDTGKTSLVSGDRVLKSAPRVAAYGTVDETNATIGLARVHTIGEADAALSRIQNDLFDLGADLATPGEDFENTSNLRIVEAQVARLEHEIDLLNDRLLPLTSFILPGGTPAAAALHLSRTVARRAERDMVTMAETEPVNPAAIRYINRLSDYLFVLARHLNDNGAQDVLWVPGANR